ncbi:uncharacterized protein [Panulirus ornatus]|uniref:uncharacterized protein isoform X2 n=2 Tax=Panulirus ornatus TaxID=150431 RepID=UPI003A8A895F
MTLTGAVAEAANERQCSRNWETMEEDELQQAGPQVVVVQQPVVARRRTEDLLPPHLRRGLKMSNGCTIPGTSIVVLGVGGFLVLLLGMVMFSRIDDLLAFGLGMLILGGACAITSCRLGFIARRDYNALPPDHPDRIKYSSRPVVALPDPDVGVGTTTYQFPPTVHEVDYPSTSIEGQEASWPASSTVAQVNNPSPLPPPSLDGRTDLWSPTAPISSQLIEDDLPPSYEEAIRNAQYTHVPGQLT